jgi:ABC-type bacteriocin/lantibiotic exporter with double-glycine peptidase domain
MYNINGEMVLMATQSHVVCGYGYNDEGVLISDPDSSRRKRVIPWDSFMRMWDSMDQYAMAVTRT